MIANLRARPDPSIAVDDGPARAPPSAWRDHVGDSEAERRFALRAELAALAPDLPLTMAALEPVALDALHGPDDQSWRPAVRHTSDCRRPPPWFAAFAATHDTSAIVEVLSTGGGGYLLLDPSRDRSVADDPDGREEIGLAGA